MNMIIESDNQNVGANKISDQKSSIHELISKINLILDTFLSDEKINLVWNIDKMINHKDLLQYRKSLKILIVIIIYSEIRYWSNISIDIEFLPTCEIKDHSCILEGDLLFNFKLSSRRLKENDIEVILNTYPQPPSTPLKLKFTLNDNYQLIYSFRKIKKMPIFYP